MIQGRWSVFHRPCFPKGNLCERSDGATRSPTLLGPVRLKTHDN